jgi:hypothetical protein
MVSVLMCHQSGTSVYVSKFVKLICRLLGMVNRHVKMLLAPLIALLFFVPISTFP